MPELSPLVVFAAGMAVVVGMISWARLNAFLALLSAALLVSVLSPGAWETKVSRVAESFGASVGKIGIVIALATIVGECMIESGAADRIVVGLLSAFGRERSHWALLSSGYVLSVPVFFDTVFYLLVPVARSFGRREPRGYLRALVAIAGGAAITHTLVPPTPGPLAMAATLGVDVGTMIVVGALVGLPPALASHAFGKFVAARVVLDAPADGDAPPPSSSERDESLAPTAALPSLWVSLLPVMLPVVLIGASTVTDAMARSEGTAPGPWQRAAEFTAWVGNPNFALLLAAIASLCLVRLGARGKCTPLGPLVERALTGGGVIILITAAGAAFGAMLQVAGVGSAISSSLGAGSAEGVGLILLGFAFASLLKMAQGSGTAAMVVGSSMLAAMIGDRGLPMHPVYLATAVGAGSLVGSWMNDSGFWIFTKMGGLTEAQALRTWTPLLTFLGIVTLLTTLVLATLLPMAE